MLIKVRGKGIENNVDINLFATPIDDIARTQLKIGKKDLCRFGIFGTKFIYEGKVSVGRKIVGDTEGLNIGLLNEVAKLAPDVATITTVLIVLLRSGRMHMEIPLTPLGSA